MKTPLRRRLLSCTVLYTYLIQLAVGCSPGPEASGQARQTRQPLAPPTGYALVGTNEVTPGVTVGATAFSHTVGVDGQAEVTVPIWTPKGRGGLEPHVAIQYASRGGQGFLGQGWGISGLSQVSTCRANPAQDGAYGGSNPGAYCLDGQRLVLTSGTDINADLAEFRAEVNGFDKVIAHNPAHGLTPDSFEVRRQSGQIETYGAVGSHSHWHYEHSLSAAWAAAPGGMVHPPVLHEGWCLEAVADRSGNTIQFAYQSPGNTGLPTGKTGQPQISKISYGGAYARSLSFTYEARSDPRWSGQVYLDKRLLRIDVAAPNVLSDTSFATAPGASPSPVLKSYRFGYLAPPTAVTRLSSITECDGAGVCKVPLQFDYTPDAIAFDEIDTSITGLPIQSQYPAAMNGTNHLGPNGLEFADLNADGLDDVVYRSFPYEDPSVPAEAAAKWVYRLNSATGFGPVQLATVFLDTTYVTSVRRPQFINLNRDETPEALIPSAATVAGNTNTVFSTFGWSSTPAPGFFSSLVPTPTLLMPLAYLDVVGLSSASIIGDLDGDKLADLVLKQGCGTVPNGGVCTVAFSKNNSAIHDAVFASPVALSWIKPIATGAASSPLESLIGNPIYLQDLDGNGVDELIIRPRQTFGTSGGFAPDFHVFTPSTTGDSPNYASDISPDGVVVFGDFGGDGYPTGLTLEPAGIIAGGRNSNLGAIPPFRNKRTLSITPALSAAASSALSQPNEARVADFDGDGLDDILLVSTMTLITSHGAGGFTSSTLPIIPGFDSVTGNQLEGSGRRFEGLLDYNGDGLADISVMQMAPIGAGSDRSERKVQVWQRKGPPAGLLTSISGAASPTVQFTHEPLKPGAAYYQPGTTCSYPQTCLKKGMWVVTHASTESPVAGSPNVIDYSYADGRVDATGRGWLGFGSRTVTDTTTGRVVTTTFDNSTSVSSSNPAIHFYPYAMQPSSEVVQIDQRPTGTTSGVVSKTQTTFDRTATFNGAAVSGALATSQLSTSRVTYSEAPVTGTTVGAFAALASSRTSYVYDGFGNVTSATSESFEGDFGALRVIPSGVAVRKLQTTAVFTPNDPVQWLVSRPFHTEVASTEPARTGVVARTVTRKTDFTYEPNSTLIKTVQIEPGAQPPEAFNTSGISRLVTLTHDSYGNVTHVLDAASSQARNTDIGWDTLDATFPFKVTNDLGHVQNFYYHSGLGQLAVADSILGNRTVTWFDGFGRTRTVDGPTSADTSVNYGVDPTGLQMISSATAGGGDSSQFFDKWNELQRREWTGFNGQHTTEAFAYDRQGRLSSATLPYYDSETPRLTAYAYDASGRVLSVQSPMLATTSYGYNGLAVTVADPDGNQVRTTRDGSGRIKSIAAIEPGTNREVTTRQEYAPFGLLESVLDPQGNESTIQYDVLGRVVASSDLNASSQGMLYDGYGQVKYAVDGTATSESYIHDSLGRLQFAVGAAGAEAYTWDTAPNGLGQLNTATSADNIGTKYKYDALGREAYATWTVHGPSSATYTLESHFDAFDRPSQLVYPSVGGSSFSTDFGYTAEGSLNAISLTGTSQSQPALWNRTEASATGQTTKETFGNGATTVRAFDKDERLQYQSTSDASGTLLQQLALEYTTGGIVKSRHDPLAKTTEDFAHDFLHRMTKWTVYQNCRKSELQYDYDDLGNIVSSTVNAGFGATARYQYGGANAGPQAVTGTTSGGVQSAYGYGAGGLQTTAPNRSLTKFTSFQLPSHMANASSDVSYSYDGSHVRTVKASTSGTSTTYIGGLYEKRADSSGSNLHVFNVAGVAQVEWPEAGGKVSPARVNYLHSDHLGTAETVTDSKGAVLEKMKYEPFGQRRYANALAVPAALGHTRGIGFGGHEPDDEFGLLNMRGRIYDPGLRRFLTPDPIVHSMGSSQALNRYSFVANSPLNLVDPTGWDPDAIISGSYESNFGFVGYSGSPITLFSSASQGGRSGPSFPHGTFGPPGDFNPQGPGAAPASRHDANGAGWSNPALGGAGSPGGATGGGASSLGGGVSAGGRGMSSGDFLAQAAQSSRFPSAAALGPQDLPPGVFWNGRRPQPGLGAYIAPEEQEHAAIMAGINRDAMVGVAAAQIGLTLATFGINLIFEGGAEVVAEATGEVAAEETASAGEVDAAAAELAEDPVRFHHSYPKYLGGEHQQILEPLPKSLHDAYHSGLDKILPRQAGTAYYDSMAPAARSQMLQDLGAYTKAFDAKHGTQLFDAMVRESFSRIP